MLLKSILSILALPMSLATSIVQVESNINIQMPLQPEQTSSSVPIRLLTHNIRYATNYPFKGEELWSIRKRPLINELRFNTFRTPEAFICLQEVLHNQLLDIHSGLEGRSKHTSWKYIGVGRDDGKTKGEYSPIFYQPNIWELLGYKTVWLSETPEKPSKGWDASSIRILTIGKFKHRQAGKELVVMNTHLDDHGSRARLEAAKIIVGQVEAYSKDNSLLPVYLAGDFNSETHMEAYRYLADSSPMQDIHDLVPPTFRYGHQDTFTGFGYGPQSRIDFLFVKIPKKDITLPPWIESYAVLENKFEDGVYNSDHRAVIADVLLE